MGVRKANELLFLNKPMYAKEAVECGFANAIIDDLGDNDWFDVMKIPAIKSLLKSDYRTIVNMK
jgi:hypothetical protein